MNPSEPRRLLERFGLNPADFDLTDLLDELFDEDCQAEPTFPPPETDDDF